jgi:hypothetical protein
MMLRDDCALSFAYQKELPHLIKRWMMKRFRGASFIVNGAAPAKNSAFTSAGAELRLSKRRFAFRQVRCRRAPAPGGNGKRARSISGLMSGSTLYDTVLLLSIVAAIVVGAWLLWRI